jgi:hypothetical protein
MPSSTTGVVCLGIVHTLDLLWFHGNATEVSFCGNGVQVTIQHEGSARRFIIGCHQPKNQSSRQRGQKLMNG